MASSGGGAEDNNFGAGGGSGSPAARGGGGGGPAGAGDDGRHAAREAIVQQLVAMSFPEDTARLAMEASGGLSIDAALSILFCDSDDSLPDLEDIPDDGRKGGGGDLLMMGVQNSTDDEPKQMYGLEDAIATMQRAGEEDFRRAKTLLDKILGNILREPAELKFRRINPSNATLERELFCVSGAHRLLLSVGFQPEGAVRPTLPPPRPAPPPPPPTLASRPNR